MWGVEKWFPCFPASNREWQSVQVQKPFTASTLLFFSRFILQRWLTQEKMVMMLAGELFR